MYILVILLCLLFLLYSKVWFIWSFCINLQPAFVLVLFLESANQFGSISMLLYLNHTLIFNFFLPVCACRFLRVAEQVKTGFYSHYFGIFFVMLIMYNLMSIARQVSWISPQGKVLWFCPSYCLCWSFWC